MGLIYDSMALTLQDWCRDAPALCAAGWEVVKAEPQRMSPGYAEIYLRRLFVVDKRHS